jgi:hypothetical protein
MMIIWWSKNVGVILNVLVCDIWINVLLQTNTLVGPLCRVNWNARWNNEKLHVTLRNMSALNGEELTVPCQLPWPEDPPLLPVHKLSLFAGTFPARRRHPLSATCRRSLPCRQWLHLNNPDRKSHENTLLAQLSHMG